MKKERMKNFPTDIFEETKSTKVAFWYGLFAMTIFIVGVFIPWFPMSTKSGKIFNASVVRYTYEFIKISIELNSPKPPNPNGEDVEDTTDSIELGIMPMVPLVFAYIMLIFVIVCVIWACMYKKKRHLIGIGMSVPYGLVLMLVILNWVFAFLYNTIAELNPKLNDDGEIIKTVKYSVPKSFYYYFGLTSAIGLIINVCVCELSPVLRQQPGMREYFILNICLQLGALAIICFCPLIVITDGKNNCQIKIFGEGGLLKLNEALHGKLVINYESLTKRGVELDKLFGIAGGTDESGKSMSIDVLNLCVEIGIPFCLGVGLSCVIESLTAASNPKGWAVWKATKNGSLLSEKEYRELTDAVKIKYYGAWLTFLMEAGVVCLVKWGISSLYDKVKALMPLTRIKAGNILLVYFIACAVVLFIYKCIYNGNVKSTAYRLRYEYDETERRKPIAEKIIYVPKGYKLPDNIDRNVLRYTDEIKIQSDTQTSSISENDNKSIEEDLMRYVKESNIRIRELKAVAQVTGNYEELDKYVAESNAKIEEFQKELSKMQNE